MIDSSAGARVRTPCRDSLGTPRDAEGLLEAFNDEYASPQPCELLARRPAGVRLVVQRPGDMLLLGELVPHATCNLEDAMGIGNQMGSYEHAWVDLDAQPRCGWRGAILCEQSARERAAAAADMLPDWVRCPL